MVILTLCIRSSSSVGSGRCSTYHHAMMRRHFFSSPLKCVERECDFFMMPHLLDIIAYCLFSCQNERASARMGERSYLCYVLYSSNVEGSFNLLCTCQMETSTFPSAWNYINARTCSTFVSSHRYATVQ